MLKKKSKITGLFLVAACDLLFLACGERGGSNTIVLGESPKLSTMAGIFQHAFRGYDVHIYRIANP